MQHLTALFNVGEHNIIRLEGADWNDGLDMARTRGESVAFTALYASNLRQLSELVLALEQLGVPEVEIAAEMLPLLDTLYEAVDYASIAAKHERLNDYFESVRHTLSGNKVRVSLIDLANDLHRKSEWMLEHLRAQEWITNRDGLSWFNGYYDNDGQRVEGDHANGVRMTLTGQVFTLMGGIATDEQAREIVRAADRYLYEPAMGGYRLNTDFGEVLLNLGRCFGFAFGHKENGAMFSHMAVMYANALYQRGFVAEGFKALNELYQHCQNFEVEPHLSGFAGIHQRTRTRHVSLSHRFGELVLADFDHRSFRGERHVGRSDVGAQVAGGAVRRARPVRAKDVIRRTIDRCNVSQSGTAGIRCVSNQSDHDRRGGRAVRSG